MQPPSQLVPSAIIGLEVVIIEVEVDTGQGLPTTFYADENVTRTIVRMLCLDDSWDSILVNLHC